ncbi:MAG: hypothetical protein LBK70_00260 [Clostridiales bacterium]|jgi:hypothetical protein|nr:hypothetical protein [Clostridiales bacterium]
MQNSISKFVEVSFVFLFVIFACVLYTVGRVGESSGLPISLGRDVAWTTFGVFMLFVTIFHLCTLKKVSQEEFDAIQIQQIEDKICQLNQQLQKYKQ